MSEAPRVIVPPLDVHKELRPLMEIITEYAVTEKQKIDKIKAIPQFYLKDGNLFRAEQIFRTHQIHNKLLQLIDFLSEFTTIDETITDFDLRELSRLKQKVDVVNKRIISVRNYFTTWFDPRKTKIRHDDKLEVMFNNGYLKLSRLIGDILYLIKSNEALIIQRGKDDFKEMQIKRIESVKYPEGMRAEPPDVFAEGEERASEEIDRLREEKEMELESVTHEEHQAREIED